VSQVDFPAAATDRVVGVIGGMGPDATAAFLQAVLHHSGPVEADQQHIPLLVFNNPKVPDRNAALAGRGPSPGPALAAMARALERAGAEFLVMPCNTAHAYASAVVAATPLPFVSIVEETCRAAVTRCPSLRRAGLLGTPACVAAGLYSTGLAAYGVEAVCCDTKGMARFIELLYAVKAGERGDAVRAGMAGLAADLAERGAETIIAACTEVPLVLSTRDLSLPLLDSLDVLASQCVRYSRREIGLPAARA